MAAQGPDAVGGRAATDHDGPDLAGPMGSARDNPHNAVMESKRLSRAGAFLAIAAAAALLLSSCGHGVDRPAAIAIAEKFAADSQPTGTQVSDVQVAAVSEVGEAWRIEVSFRAAMPGDVRTQPNPIHLVVDVDKSSGVPRIAAQG